ncbi:zinc finger protein [Elysia marginata]|uniref:Zinc finger protein n=1 Tax=Elysia marginata TaxID=1093978 RepID=A0AAV4IPA2_9GAST|nr:zinc finger protein [Elysia marginata]
MSDHESGIEDLRVENDPGTENEEDFAGIDYKDGDISSEDAQVLETENHISTQKAEKKDKCGNKPKVKMKTLTIDGQLVYFCMICDKIFTRRKDKLNHELAHSGETMLSCSECGKEYLHESSLISHMRTHDGDPLFMCDLCPKMFAQSHHLKTHILSHSEPTNFTCKTCYKEFATAADLNHHSRSSINQEMSYFWCKMCKVYFCRTHGPECRKRIHAYQCSACNELFYTQKKLRIHLKKFAHFSHDKPDYIEPLTEEELYPHKLPESLKRSQSAKENSILKQSYKNLPNKTAKRCTDQDLENIVPRKKFKLSPRKIFLEDEQSSTSVQDSAPERKHETDSELRSPSKNRKGKPYCKKCNRSFKDSFDLERHRSAVHVDASTDLPSSKQASTSSLATPFSCKICGAGFTSKEDLERHGFKHSGERMHVCPMCGEEFPQALQLTKHLKTHMGDHPYRCSQCGKSFRLKIQLIQHVRLHIVQDANACDKCPSKFNTRAELQNHKLQAHRESLRRTRLLKHLQLQHCTTELECAAQTLTQFGLKRSLSMQDADRLVSSGNIIKTEPCGSDCESEQSFCSSFTRDSEKSDVFKYSSDDSFSFKTTMAKERIRLRRKLRRKQQNLLEQQMSSEDFLGKKVKHENIGIEGTADVKSEHNVEEEEDSEMAETQEVLDMMIELNVVQSEKENVTTVYVDVTDKPPVKQELPVDVDSLPVRDETGDGYIYKNMLDLCNYNSTELLNFPSTLERDNTFLGKYERSEITSRGNTVMFEFDPEELGVGEDDLSSLVQTEHSSSRSPREKKQDVELSLNPSNTSNQNKIERWNWSLPATTVMSVAAGNESDFTTTLCLSTTTTSSSDSTTKCGHFAHSTSSTCAANIVLSCSASVTLSTSDPMFSFSSFVTSTCKTTSRLLSATVMSTSNSNTHSGLASTVASHGSTNSESSGLAKLQEVFQNSSKYLPLSTQSKSGVKQNESHPSELRINPEIVHFESAKATKRDLKGIEDRSMISQVLSRAAVGGSTKKYQEKSASLEPAFIKPLITDELNSLKRTQNKKSCKSHRKENSKAQVNTGNLCVITASSLENHGKEQGLKPPALPFEKSDLGVPQLNTSSTASQNLSSFSLLSFPSSSSNSNCGYIPSHNTPLSTSTPAITSAFCSSISVPTESETRTSITMQQSGSWYPNQNEDMQTPVPPRQQPSAASSTIVIQPSSIFDTNNPLLRDMNMMDLVRACTPAPALSTPRPVAIPTPLPQPEALLQPHNNIHVASVMDRPVNIPVPSIPDVPHNPIPPQTPAPIFQPSLALPHPPSSISVPPYGILDKRNPMDFQMVQGTNDISSYNISTNNNRNNNNLTPTIGVQGISCFTPHNLTGLSHQDFYTQHSVNPVLSPAFGGTSLQQSQQHLMDLNSVLNPSCIASGGGLVGNAAAEAVSSHMRSLQESFYLSAVHSNGLQQNLNGMLVNGFNPQLQPNMGAASLGGGGCLSSGTLSIETGGMMGPVNVQSLPGAPHVGFGGQAPTVPQPQMLNVFNSVAASAFPSTIGFPGTFGCQPSAQISTNLMNAPIMLPAGTSCLPPPNLVGVLGQLEPGISNLPPHFTGFPHL